MALFISKSDIQEVRPMADLHSDRINTYIREAQDHDIKPILGDAFFYDFEQKLFDSNASEYTVYQKLLNGKAYTYNSETIYFQGIKNMHVYFALARLIVDNQTNITRFSVVQKTNAQSTPVSASTLRLQASELRQLAINIRDETVQFLLENNTSYPLFKTTNYIKDETGFNFFSA